MPELINHRDSNCVSIYMPVVTTGREVQQNPIRLKNLVKRAGELMQVAQADYLATSLRMFIDAGFNAQNWGAETFGPHTSGIAIFHSSAATHIHPLPVEVESMVVVQDRFHLKPILQMLVEPDVFSILTMSRNQVRLLNVNGPDVRRIGEEILPESLDATLPAFAQEKQFQMHTGPGDSVFYHGHGTRDRRADEDMRRYLSLIDDGVAKLLGNADRPLVLAGVHEITSMFRALTRHRNLIPRDLEGNMDGLSDVEVRQHAVSLARPHLRERRRRASERVNELTHTKRVATDFGAIMRAAVDGRVGTLFLERGHRWWGRFDEQNRTIEFEEKQTNDNEDLLDLAAVRTFECGGDVFVVDAESMPVEQKPATAILRY